MTGVTTSLLDDDDVSEVSSGDGIFVRAGATGNDDDGGVAGRWGAWTG